MEVQGNLYMANTNHLLENLGVVSVGQNLDTSGNCAIYMYAGATMLLHSLNLQHMNFGSIGSGAELQVAGNATLGAGVNMYGELNFCVKGTLSDPEGSIASSVQLNACSEQNILSPSQQNHTITLGDKAYELSNHLGNVLVTITDKKTLLSPPLEGSGVAGWTVDVASATDYYAFGASLRSSGTYRYGFNGKEKDGEWDDNYSFEKRIYNKNLGRWYGIDNKYYEYYDLSPYSYCANNPIKNIEIDGDKFGDVNVMILLEDKHVKPSFRVIGDWQIFSVNNMTELNKMPNFGNIKVINNLMITTHGAGRMSLYPSINIVDFSMRNKKGARIGAINIDVLESYESKDFSQIGMKTLTTLNFLRNNVFSKLADESSVFFPACGAGKGLYFMYLVKNWINKSMGVDKNVGEVLFNGDNSSLFQDGVIKKGGVTIGAGVWNPLAVLKSSNLTSSTDRWNGFRGITSNNKVNFYEGLKVNMHNSFSNSIFNKILNTGKVTTEDGGPGQSIPSEWHPPMVKPE